MIDETLTMRRTWPGAQEDYAVLMQGVPIGRVHRHLHQPGPEWSWSITLALARADVHGRADSLDEAKAAWKACWARVRPSITDDWLAAELARLNAVTQRLVALDRRRRRVLDRDGPV